MRLPTRTALQQQREDSRQLMEAIYDAFVHGRRAAVVPHHGEPLEQCQVRVSGNHRDFWMARGYALCTHRQGGVVEVWIVPRPVPWPVTVTG